MSIENPESQTVNADKVEPILSDEVLEALDTGKMAVSELSAEQKIALLDHLKKQKEETPEGEPPPPLVEKKEEKKEVEPEKKVEKTNYKDLHKIQADEENRYRQKYEAAKKRTEGFKTGYEEIVKKERQVEGDVDPIDEKGFQEFVKQVKLDNQRLAEEVGFLREKLAEKDQFDAEDYLDRAESAREKSLYASIGALQEEYESLQTKTPFQKMNKDWGSFLDKLVKNSGLKAEDVNVPEGTDPIVLNEKLRDKALRLYNEDDDFKENSQKLLPKSLQDENEMKKYEIIVDLYNKSQKPASMKAAWLEELDNKGILQESIGQVKRDALIEGSNRAADAMITKSPNTINPDDGPGVSPSNAKGSMSFEVAKATVMQITEALKQRSLTDEERSLQMKAMEVLKEKMATE